MIVTISGSAGSGKSTLSKNLAAALGWKRYSAGDFTRSIAQEKGISIHELQELEAKDASIDRLVDKKTLEAAAKHKNVVIDAWLGFHLLPKSLKLYTICDVDEAAKRIFEAGRHDEHSHNVSLAATKKKMLRRIEVNRERWKRYYNIDISNEHHYDFIIDTTKSSKEKTLAKALAFVKKKMRSKN